jgi:crotonyl-CoA reductase
VQHIVDTISSGEARPEDYAALSVPESYLAVTVHADETAMFEGVPSAEKDPRRSLHIEQVPTPEVGPGEALVAVMASAINYNTVWSSIFEPVDTFGFLRRYGRVSPLSRKHDRPYHVLGSDLAGVVLRTGPGVNAWRPGDEVVAHCLSVELEQPQGHDDTMLDPQQRIWGFETNFGGLAQLALVKANQLMPKPGHLTWEEAACPGLVNSTAYRQLVSHHGAGMKLGDTVLIWGASGGLGSYATQLALAAGATPVCVVSSPAKADICKRMGVELVLDRSERGYRFWKDEHTQDPRSGSGSAPTSASSPAGATWTSSSSTPAGRPSAPASTSPGAAARSSRAPRRPATSTSTTTGTCGCSSSASSVRTSPITQRHGRPTI